jgi:hypothetical protein
MIFGLDLSALVLMIAGALVIFLLIDLFTTGGSTCAGMVGGMAGAMGTPWGLSVLLLALAAVVVAWLLGSPGG